MSKATVYNTLNLFASHGLIRQLSVDGSRAWFDSNVVPHYHFHDEATGALTDLAVPEVEFSRLPAAARNGSRRHRSGDSAPKKGLESAPPRRPHLPSAKVAGADLFAVAVLAQLVERRIRNA